MGTLRADLALIAEEVRETHISWVFLTKTEVYKVKKPVALGFLDFSTRDDRKRACDAEVQLGARLAPDVYRGVVPVVLSADGHRIDGPGEPVDWAVHMRRLRDEDSAEARLGRGVLDVREIDRIASCIASFHERARADEETARFGTAESIAVNVRENFEQTRAGLGDVLSAREEAEIEERQLSFLRDREDVIARRIASGRVRDGHGDLRLEHVYLEGERVVIIDCIEFNERFRFGDVCSDLAFLSMDLAWHGRADLAERLLATYARDTSDFDLYRVVDFYESYRAYVRGKIAMMLANDEHAPVFTRERARAQARRYLRLALAAERPAMLPACVVAIGGLLASGKSTIADRLGAIMGAPAINTDRVRKHLLGARPTDKIYEGSWAGAYDPKFTERVYEEVHEGARAVVGSGRPVILDASFRTRSMRAQAKALAAELGVPFRFVECTADHAILRARLEKREHAESVSDGRLEIFDEFVASWETVDELTRDEHVVLDTAQPLDACLEALRERIPTWPEGLTR